MADGEKEFAVIPRPIAKVVSSLIIVLESGQEVTVPVNSAANKLKSQVIVAQMRDFLSSQLKLYTDKDKKQKPSDIKILVDSFAKLEETARFAYAPGLNKDAGGDDGDSLLKAAAAMAGGMAEGMAKAHMRADAERESKILDLGRSVTVTPAQIVEEKAG